MGGILPQVGDYLSCFAFLFYTTVLALCFLHDSKFCESGKEKSKRDLKYELPIKSFILSITFT